MAKRQTRRTVSFNRDVYTAIMLAATEAGESASEFVTRNLRTAGVKLPTTEHMESAAVFRMTIGKIRAKRNRMNGWMP